VAEIKLSYSVESVVTLAEEGELHLLDVFARVKSGEIPHDVAPPGFLAAIDKLTLDAPKELILRTILGEVTSGIVESEIPRFYPSGKYGFEVRIAKVAYQETPEKLDPPLDAVPQVLTPGNRSIH
jgi:hypothetical protein